VLLRNLLVRCLAIYCLTASAPGATEVLEDLVHFVGAGHTVHSSTEHEGTTEHGCSGFFHVCHCCGQAQALPSFPLANVERAPRTGREPLAPATGEALPGYRAPPFRPPSA
jgi:hypothetical protein